MIAASRALPPLTCTRTMRTHLPNCSLLHSGSCWSMAVLAGYLGFPFLSTSASVNFYDIGPTGLETGRECVKDDVHVRRGTLQKRLLAPFEGHADKELRTVVWNASKGEGEFSGRPIPAAFRDKLCLEDEQAVLLMLALGLVVVTTVTS